jgi:hypothetical protein
LPLRKKFNCPLKLIFIAYLIQSLNKNCFSHLLKKRKPTKRTKRLKRMRKRTKRKTRKKRRRIKKTKRKRRKRKIKKKRKGVRLQAAAPLLVQVQAQVQVALVVQSLKNKTVQVKTN